MWKFLPGQDIIGLRGKLLRGEAVIDDCAGIGQVKDNIPDWGY